MLNVTDAVLESAIPSLDLKAIVPAFAPDSPFVGVKVAASKAVFIAAKEPDAVKEAEPLPPPPKVIPAVPNETVPPVTVNVTV